jgi:hypothetical protein
LFEITEEQSVLCEGRYHEKGNQRECLPYCSWELFYLEKLKKQIKGCSDSYCCDIIAFRVIEAIFAHNWSVCDVAGIS